MAEIPSREHVIPLPAARALVAAHRSQAGSDAALGGYFARDAIDRVLAQPGCAGLRFYYGRHEDGSLALVVVGVNAAGADMTATTIDNHQPCPPYCDPTSALTTTE